MKKPVKSEVGGAVTHDQSNDWLMLSRLPVDAHEVREEDAIKETSRLVNVLKSSLDSCRVKLITNLYITFSFEHIYRDHVGNHLWKHWWAITFGAPKREPEQISHVQYECKNKDPMELADGRILISDHHIVI